MQRTCRVGVRAVKTNHYLSRLSPCWVSSRVARDSTQPAEFGHLIVWRRSQPAAVTVTGIPRSGQMTKAAKPTSSISKMLAGTPYMKNSPLLNCFES